MDLESQSMQAQWAAWKSLETDRLAKHGMEPGSSGFHLLRPPSDPKLIDPFMHSFPDSSLIYDFHEVDRAYVDVSYLQIGGLEYQGTPVSMNRIFENSTVGTARLHHDPATSSYSVVVEFTEDGLAILANLLGTSAGGPDQFDWYGLPHPDGQAPTEMKAVLVKANKAYLPISITNIVAQGLVNTPIIIANNLDGDTATKIVADIGF